MHEYAVFGYDRAAIGRWIGIASIILSSAISQLSFWAQGLTGFEIFTKAAISAGLIYFFLHWVFNQYLWKYIPRFQIPNISGKWEVSGRTLNEDGSTKYEWSATLGIEQTWDKISIHLQTPKSQSFSYTATIAKKHGPTGGWRLSYSYKNEPELDQVHELNAHKGYCEIEIDKGLAIARSAYFNSGGRRTFGVMDLSREKNE